jgi:hypothetical protein
MTTGTTNELKRLTLKLQTKDIQDLKIRALLKGLTVSEYILLETKHDQKSSK